MFSYITCRKGHKNLLTLEQHTVILFCLDSDDKLPEWLCKGMHACALAGHYSRKISDVFNIYVIYGSSFWVAESSNKALYSPN